ncbi:saxitoxin and tetrodotoxin-binding protein 1-like isoform X2 [Thunnus maccoyii]|uniref:saxitoxin and tetrodotoxin-binding protein 1-like isoform X2 n=1 Tax=Thunnus maccoyii TaxID=8240 RepID=UPI001C4C2284|nr:saxitoxin and tetrodotoxin-binding protein 1-like isoform X2 [Thunnus maccoyii]
MFWVVPFSGYAFRFEGSSSYLPKTHDSGAQELPGRLLHGAGLTLKLKKCRFCCPKLKFLGHVVSKEGVQADPAKMEALHDYPVPRKLKEVQRFLGPAGWMSIVKRVVLLLLLLAALCTDAAPTTEECDSVKKTLTKDLSTVIGDWVLVWAVTDDPIGSGLLGSLSSSHVEMRLLPDNKSIVYSERNLFQNKSCISYLANLTMPSDPTDADQTLIIETATMKQDGVVQPHNESGGMDFYKSCSDCLLMVYKGTSGRYLLSYRREGQHGDVEQLKAALSDHQKQAECFGFSHDQPFSYDGAADFCHKKSSTAEQS